jgi:hypothetical protein
MIFSQRYHRALLEQRLSVNLPGEARPKLGTCLDKYDVSVGVKRDPHDNWISNSSVCEEAIIELMSEHGWIDIPNTTAVAEGKYFKAFRHVILHEEPKLVFDLIELALGQMEDGEREKCRKKINEIFDVHDCAWRIADGEFFKLDADFMGARLAANAHDALVANRYVGAADEFAKARQVLGTGDAKDSIFYAAKSIESVMKVMSGSPHANADQLVKIMLTQGYFDDLPESIRNGFAEQVMKTLPFIRNKLAGHGQGADIVNVPALYGDLAVQLAAVFHNFLIGKHLERTPPIPAKPANVDKAGKRDDMDDELPF